MTENESQGTSPFTYIKYAFYAIIAFMVIKGVFFDKGSDEPSYTEETIEEPTQGIITKVKEIEADLFKITDEELVPAKEDSRIIASFLDNTVDTFTLDEARLEDASNPKRSMIRSVAMAGMFGFMMGRPMSGGVSRAAYADDRTFNKSNTTGKSQLKSTASRRVQRTPTKTGYGSGKSTRSYGG